MKDNIFENGDNVQVVVKLYTNKTDIWKNNTILTFWHIREKNTRIWKDCLLMARRSL